MGSSVFDITRTTRYVTHQVFNRKKMVIKMDPAIEDTENVSADNVSSPVSADPLRGVSSASGGHVGKAKQSTELEFSRLKNLVPSISKKTAVSKLNVILEAIRYIDQLQGQLVEQIQDQRLHPSVASEFLGSLGKENQSNPQSSTAALKFKLKPENKDEENHQT